MLRLILIDGPSLLHRAYHALPPLTTTQGEQVGAVFGFTSMLLKVLQELKPDFVAAAWDLPEPTFRDQLYTQYKAHRPEIERDLLDQEKRVKEVLEKFGIPVFAVAGFEADDVIGTLCKRAREQERVFETIIVTGDLDALQLVNEQVKVYTSRKGFSDTVLYDPVKVKERYGLEPQQLIDYKALRGDPSDNIPGVKGIGEKGAIQLLQRYQNLTEVYRHLGDLSDNQRKTLTAGQNEAQLSRQLAEIRRDVPMQFDIEKCRLEINRETVVTLFSELNFRSLVNRLPLWKEEKKSVEQEELFAGGRRPGAPRPSVGRSRLSAGEGRSPERGRGGEEGVRSEETKVVQNEEDLDEFLGSLGQSEMIAVDVETTGIDSHQAELVGIALGVSDGRTFFLPATILASEKARASLKAVISSKPVTAHNLKYDAAVLERYGLRFNLERAFDTIIAAYLLQAGQGRLGLKELAFSELGMVIPTLAEVKGQRSKVGNRGLEPKKRKSFDWSGIPLSELANYAGLDALATLRLKDKFSLEFGRSENEKLEKLFYEVEMPLVSVLLEMEKTGILLDRQYLGDLSGRLTHEITKLEKAVYAAVGHEFNLNSPKQLEAVLFDELRLPSQRQTAKRTHRSTDEAVLRKLLPLHPAVAPLLRYRELFKLKSTYIDPLPTMVDSAGRVHTQFNQTRAATGRLSSENPNLQNIPVDPQIGLRKAFVAAEGSKFLIADYSQIELRIMAHLSGDEHLIDSFEHDQDIHAATAARIFDKFIDEVSPEERRVGKTVNFGVMYGLSAHGLSEMLGIEHTKAQVYIDEYFENYPRVKFWIEENLKKAREQGFVESLLGRRRKIPELSASNYALRSAGERMATNMPIQATAADMIKIAMVKIKSKIKNQKSKILLQVHDELVFEVIEDEIERVGEIVKKEMEQALPLRVPVRVDLKVGQNWQDLDTAVI